MLEAVKGSGGVIDYIAVRLGCGWECARNYINKYPAVMEAAEEERCKFHAKTYSKFHEAINSGERWAIERVLDTSARRNGHGIIQHQQVDHTTNGQDITAIEVTYVRTTPTDQSQASDSRVG